MEEKQIAIDMKGESISIDQLQEIIDDHGNVKLRISNVLVDDKSLSKIQLKFPNHLIVYVTWSKTLIVGESISTDKVMHHLDKFLECFIEFDKVAHHLMKTLTSAFGLEYGNLAQLNELKRNRSQNQRGTINEEWDYYLHGAECAFTSKKSAQHIEVKVIYGTEYGVIDNYFLFRFIQTTDKLSGQLELLESKPHNLRKVINVLQHEGYLTSSPNANFDELILNRNRL